MLPRRPTLEMWVTALIAAPFVLVLGLVVLWGVRVERTVGEQWPTDTSRAILSIASEALAEPLREPDLTRLEQAVDRLVGESGVIYAAVRGVDGHVAAVAGDGWVPDEALSQDLCRQAVARARIVHSAVGGRLVSCGPIAGEAEPIGALELAADQERAWLVVSSVRRTLLWLISGVAVLGTAAGMLFAQRLSRSLLDLARAADEIGHGNGTARVPVEGTHEIALLGAAMGRMSARAQDLRSGLESQLEATERQIRRLRLAAQVAHDAAAEPTVTALLRRVVALLWEGLRAYHVGLYLVDSTGEWAILEAGAGAGAAHMLELEHRVRLAADVHVGYTALSGDAQVVTGADAGSSTEPGLRDARAEITLPLRIGDRSIGVLDIRYSETTSFDRQELAALDVLAERVSLSIGNATLFEQAQRSLEAAQKAYGALTRAEWIEMLGSRPNRGYYCNADGVVPISQRPDGPDTEDLATLNVPVVVRGQQIGTISARKPRPGGAWTAQEKSVVATLSEQLNVALESARLYEGIQRRSVRDRLIGDLAARVGQTLDVEMVLRNAAQEVRQALNLPEVTVRLAPQAQTPSEGRVMDRSRGVARQNGGGHVR